MKTHFQMNWKFIPKTLFFMVLFAGIPAAVSFADITLTSPVSGNHTFTDNTTIQLTSPPPMFTGIINVGSGQTVTANAGWDIDLRLANVASSPANVWAIYVTTGGLVDLSQNKVTIRGYGSGQSQITSGVNVYNGTARLGDNCEIYAEAEYSGTALVTSANGANRALITVGDNATLYGVVYGSHEGTVNANRGDIFIGDNAYIINDGNKCPIGYSHKAIFAFDDGVVTVGKNAEIITTGSEDRNYGIQAGNFLHNYQTTKGTIILGDNASITTEGIYSIGMFAQEAGSSITTGSVKVTTVGDQAHGIYAYGTSVAGGLGNPTVTTGAATIITSGASAYGMAASKGGSVFLGANSDVRTTGFSAIGALAWPDSAVNIGGGTSISTIGNEAAGIYAYGGTIALGDGVRVSTAGQWADGLLATDGGEISVKGVTVSAAGPDSYAVYAADSGSRIYGAGVHDITGGIIAEDAGAVQLQFHNGSRFTGHTEIAGAGAVNELTLLGANTQWAMTQDSAMTKLGMGDGFRHTLSAGRTLTTNVAEISDDAALSVMGGNLIVNDVLSGKAGQTTAGRVNLYGSAGNTSIAQLGSSNSATKLEPHFYIDSTGRGVTSLDISAGGTAYLDSLVNDATVWGFAQLNSTKYLLIDGTAGTMLGSANVYHPALTAYQVRQQGNQVYLEMDQNWSDHVWTDFTQSYIYTNGSEHDMIKIVDSHDYSAFHISFLNLDDTLAPLLRDYLNQGMTGSTLRFSLYDDMSLLLGGGEYLNPDGYVFFGWDLRDFNLLHGSNVLLNEWEGVVPEPSAWALMGLTLVGLAGPMLRRKKKR